VDNGDFHDFTFDADANTVALWVFDDYYHTQEATGKTAIQDIAGTHNLTASAGFDWQNQFTGTDPAYQNGTALNFDGVDDYLYIPAASAGDFNPRTGDFTVEAWVKINITLNSESDAIGLVHKGLSNVNANSWTVSIRGGVYNGFYLRIGDGTNGFPNISPSTNQSAVLSDGNYHYIAIVWDKTNDVCNLYLDGNNVRSASGISTVGDVNPSGEDFRIGRDYWLHFYGKIAEIRYSNKARTAQEIKESYALAKGWTWDGVGSVSNSNFSQVVSGGGTVSQQVVTTSGNLYEKNVNGTISYLNENNHTVNLTDGTHTLASVRQVSNASWSGTTVLDYFFPPKFDGTMQGLMEQNQPPHPYAFEFDGVDDYVDFGDVLDIGTNNFEISLYVKSNSFANKYFLSKYQDANNYYYIGTNASNQIVCKAVQAGATVFEYRSNTALTDNVYNFITVSKDNSGITFAINGVDAGATVVTALQPTAVQNSGSFYLGRYNTVYFAGEIGINTLHFANGAASQIYNNTKHLYQ
jgi:hypothetical protein